MPMLALLVAAAAAAATAAEAPPPRLALPLQCSIGSDCWVQNWPDDDPGPGVRDWGCGARSYDGHDGTDFRIASLDRQRAGVAVLAPAAGVVLRLRDGEADRMLGEGEKAVPGRECGNGVAIDHGGGWQSQLCHMAQGSIAVRPGQRLDAGAPIGRVGLSGSTAFPHLHLTLRYQGRAVDPAAFGAAAGQCRAGRSLWAPASGIAYAEGAVIAAGFAPGPVSIGEVMARGSDVPAPGADAAAIVAYALAIGLAPGDVVTMVLAGPDGAEIARNTLPPLARARAQQLVFAGARRPATGWPLRLTARFTVTRAGREALRRDLALALRR